MADSRPFVWNAQKDEAALLAAEDRLSNAAIAAQVGITRQGLDKWKAHPEFRARVQEHVEAFAATVRRRGIAQIESRVAALQDRWERMNQIIAERAADPTMQDVPGGSSGLVCRQMKRVEVRHEWDGFPPTVSREEVAEYAVDTGLLAQLLAHERQAAQELGQWEERKRLSGGLQITQRADLSKLSDEELAMLENLVEKSSEPGGDPS